MGLPAPKEEIKNVRKWFMEWRNERLQDNGDGMIHGFQDNAVECAIVTADTLAHDIHETRCGHRSEWFLSSGPCLLRPRKRPLSRLARNALDLPQSPMTLSNTEDDELTGPPIMCKKAEGEQENATKINAEIKVAEEEPDSIEDTKLYGKYDLYAKHLPFLQFKKGGSPDFERLLEAMKRLQAKPDYSARVAIPIFHATKDGAFEPRGFRDPMSDEQYEVALEGIKLIEKKEPVLEASMSITNGGCIVASSSGAISMHRCWAKPGADVGSDEIFSICIRKHRDKIPDIESGYWGIRARKDVSGKEIGLALK
ncbi:hypothetical protein CPB85DRAFT_1261637 [Mucidula mucida]|nr:hypothetical protein CPB85DRAFT_1261637 [Mucidula mucida]